MTTVYAGEDNPSSKQVNRTKIGGLFRFALWNIKRFSQK